MNKQHPNLPWAVILSYVAILTVGLFLLITSLLLHGCDRDVGGGYPELDAATYIEPGDVVYLVTDAAPDATQPSEEPYCHKHKKHHKHWCRCKEGRND